MERWQIPGAALAVVRDGRLALARGYGLADPDMGEQVQPDSLFRIGAVSKPVTAVAVLKLVEDGRLDLDESAFDLLADIEPPEGATLDDRLDDITIRHLLEHSGGWSRDRGQDPMFEPQQVAEALGISGPPSSEDAIRFMLGQPLEFDPGAEYGYSNFGYNVLGRVIERVTGRGYEDYVTTEVLAPMGITDMRTGRTLLADRAEGEVRYVDYPRAPVAEPVFPAPAGLPERPYGAFYLEAMDANDGWLASAVDLARFLSGVDGRADAPDMLNVSLVVDMVSRPDLPDWEDTATYYGMGWFVQPVRGDANWWHAGALPGSAALIWRREDGVSLAAVFNSSPPTLRRFLEDVTLTLSRGVAAVDDWPEHDLFDESGN
jgi:N-acyl-D-amino-acid deacylase